MLNTFGKKRLVNLMHGSGSIREKMKNSNTTAKFPLRTREFR